MHLDCQDLRCTAHVGCKHEDGPGCTLAEVRPQATALEAVKPRLTKFLLRHAGENPSSAEEISAAELIEGHSSREDSLPTQATSTMPAARVDGSSCIPTHMHAVVEATNVKNVSHAVGVIHRSSRICQDL